MSTGGFVPYSGTLFDSFVGHLGFGSKTMGPDPDADPDRHWLSRCQQKLIFAYYFWRYIYIIFQR